MQVAGPSDDGENTRCLVRWIGRPHIESVRSQHGDYTVSMPALRAARSLADLHGSLAPERALAAPICAPLGGRATGLTCALRF